MHFKNIISDNLIAESKIPRYLKEFSLTLLFILLGIDIIFMGLHALKSLGYINDPNFSVTKNWGYPEIFQYLKAAFLTICFIWLGKNYKRPQLYGWAAVFLFVLLDDSIEVHEYFGYHMGEILENAGIYGGKTMGELLVFAIMGLIIFIPLFYFFYRSHFRELNIMTQDLFMLFTLMLVFGIGVDILHDMAEVGTVLNGVLGLIEDGGEMLVMSIIVWYTWKVIQNDNFFEKRKLETHHTTGANKIQAKDHPAASRTQQGKRIKQPHNPLH